MNRNKKFKNLEDAVQYLYSKEMESNILALPPYEMNSMRKKYSMTKKRVSLVLQMGPATYKYKDPEDDSEEDNLPSISFASDKKIENKKYRLTGRRHNRSILSQPRKIISWNREKSKNFFEKARVDLFKQIFDDDILIYTITKDDIEIFIGFLVFGAIIHCHLEGIIGSTKKI